MSSMIIEVPSELKDLGVSFRRLVTDLQRVRRSSEELSVSIPFDAVQQMLSEHAQDIECHATAGVLAGLDVDAPALMIGGKLHKRVGRNETDFYTVAGPVRVERTLFREAGVRNGPTVDPVSLRCGAVDRWLPKVRQSMGMMLAHGTSREAATLSAQLDRLPYSRCSFERIGHDVGKLCVKKVEAIHHELAEAITLPRGVCSVSVSIDRTAVPLEEDVDGFDGVVSRVFRMAYCGSVTLHDKRGESLQTWRYGEMPHGDPLDMLQRMRADVSKVLTKKRHIRMVWVADGAPELWKLLRIGFARHHFPLWYGGIVQAVDFWHVIEKLGAADQVIRQHRNEVGVSKRLPRWRMALLNDPGAARKILRELRRCGCITKYKDNRQPVADAIRYIVRHRHRMRYGAIRASGLVIGSGNVEATCKSLVGIRLKRTGSRWKPDGAQEVLQLRTHLLSDRWQHASSIALRNPTPTISIAA